MKKQYITPAIYENQATIDSDFLVGSPQPTIRRAEWGNRSGYVDTPDDYCDIDVIEDDEDDDNFWSTI